METMEIRKARSQNIPAIVRVHKSCVRIINATVYSAPAISAWLKQIKSDSVKKQFHNSKWVVLTRAARVIGFAQYSTEDKELYQINITPRYANKGLGKLVYAYIEREFMKHKAKMIELNATLNAVPFYKKLGFRKVKTISFKLGSSKIRMIQMKKQLYA